MNLRDTFDAEDLEMTARLIILPRATQIPAPRQAQPPEPESPPPADTEREDAEEEDEETAAPPQVGPTPEQILEALETELPTMPEQLPIHNVRRGRTGSCGATMDKRGPHVRSVPGDPRRRGILQGVLILLTDGRANIAPSPDGDAQDGLRRIGRTIAASTLNVIVVDTQRSYLNRGEARQLAERLSAEYAFLPYGTGDQNAGLAAGVAQSREV